MIDCVQSRRLLLEVDLAELTPAADTELGRHLATCEGCRSAAAGIQAAEGALGEWLRARAPRAGAAEALAGARTAAHRRSRVRRVGATAAMLAAAALGGLLLVPRPVPPAPPFAGPWPAARGSGFSVTPPPGRAVVVLHPADPRIVVVWYLPTRRSS